MAVPVHMPGSMEEELVGAKSLACPSAGALEPRLGPNSTCDVGLPLEHTSSLGRDRGESGGLGGVLVAPARHHEKLGQLSIRFVGSGCVGGKIA